PHRTANRCSPREAPADLMSIARTRLYWNTVRHLQPVQIYGRLLFRLGRPQPELNRPPARRQAMGSWVEPARRTQSQLGPTEFRFLNVSRLLDDHGWNSSQVETLWRYNLHYFDDLGADGAGARRDWHRELIQRWIAENPP